MPVKSKKVVEEKVNNNTDICLTQDNALFGLDIGTRTVVGVVGVEIDGIFNIVAVEIEEHKQRAMLDGQIHDILKVSQVVEKVKRRLEDRIGFKLEKVSIAAAGRVLKTFSVRVDQDIKNGISISQEMINTLEFEGIRIAQSKIHEDDFNIGEPSYYCVGHSVINYYLNGYIISNLIGHKGKSIGANVLATFLPHNVIDSLYSVMKNVGLEVMSLTLEPIAAINASIPEELRMLNLALVDVGAGTSDVAITRDGSVIAYGMCPVAGDEITEKIAHHYLLDFNTAERVKLQLGSNNVISFTDIMGIEYKLNSKEIIEVIDSTVSHLAEVICEKIINCNGKSPNAVICVGGGSQTPNLVNKLSEKLEIILERVAIKDGSIIKNVNFIDNKLTGPGTITPVGIAITALMKKGHDFLQIKVNKKMISLFNSEKVSVGDALIASGHNQKQLNPKTGNSLTFEFNGEKHTIKGEVGKVGEILLNGQPTTLDRLIINGDHITIITSKEGAQAQANVEDFVKDARVKKVLLNDSEIDFTVKPILNGKAAKLNEVINEGDKLFIQEINTIVDLAEMLEINLGNIDFIVNGKKVNKDYFIEPDDVIKTINNDSKKEEIKTDNNKVQVVEDNIEDNIEDNYYEPKKRTIHIFVNKEPVTLNDKEEYILVDIFNSNKKDLIQFKGRMVLNLNGKSASFTDVIKNGDDIEISWIEI